VLPSFLPAHQQRLTDPQSLVRSGKGYGNSCHSIGVKKRVGHSHCCRELQPSETAHTFLAAGGTPASLADIQISNFGNGTAWISFDACSMIRIWLRVVDIANISNKRHAFGLQDIL